MNVNFVKRVTCFTEAECWIAFGSQLAGPSERSALGNLEFLLCGGTSGQ